MLQRVAVRDDLSFRMVVGLSPTRRAKKKSRSKDLLFLFGFSPCWPCSNFPRQSAARRLLIWDGAERCLWQKQRSGRQNDTRADKAVLQAAAVRDDLSFRMVVGFSWKIRILSFCVVFVRLIFAVQSFKQKLIISLTNRAV